MKPYSIAIDGPSGSGKSTVARLLAERLRISYLDTGAMYRTLTLYLLRREIDPADEQAVCSALDEFEMDIEGSIVTLKGEDVSRAIRSAEVTANVSVVSGYLAVREHMVELQRRISKGRSIILDGRDIGTVVLPDATLKIFLTASSLVRAKRRFNDAKDASGMSLEAIRQAIEARDHYDSHREHSPLREAHDAVHLDSSEMSIAQVLDAIIAELEKRVCFTE